MANGYQAVRKSSLFINIREGDPSEYRYLQGYPLPERVSKGDPFDSFEEMSFFIHGPHAGKQFMFCWILVKAWPRAIGAMN